MTIQVVLGSATMPVANLMKLGRGAVVPLDHRVGEPVDVVVNGRVVARGEVVVVEEDNSRFGVSLTEIVGAVGGRVITDHGGTGRMLPSSTRRCHLDGTRRSRRSCSPWAAGGRELLAFRAAGDPH